MNMTELLDRILCGNNKRLTIVITPHVRQETDMNGGSLPIVHHAAQHIVADLGWEDRKPLAICKC